MILVSDTSVLIDLDRGEALLLTQVLEPYHCRPEKQLAQSSSRPPHPEQRKRHFDELTVADVEVFYRDMSTRGVIFSMSPKKQDFGDVLAQFVDSEGAHCSVGGETA